MHKPTPFPSIMQDVMSLSEHLHTGGTVVEVVVLDVEVVVVVWQAPFEHIRPVKQLCSTGTLGSRL
jgi:hypothetical protein